MENDRLIHCEYFNEKRKGLSRPPMPGVLGEKVFKYISTDAWKLWLIEQTKLMNEYRLDPTDAASLAQLSESCEAFLFKNKSTTTK